MNHHAQRQKKRATQNKKKYHESSKKEATASKPPPSLKQKNTPQDVKTECDQHRNKHVVEQSSSPSKPQTTGTERNSFSRRKVASNWSRYDEGEMVASPDVPMGPGCGGYLRTSETDEELQLRLVQLLNLPQQTDTVAELSGKGPNYSLLGSQEDSKFITLDCHALADSLSCLPVHERLDINVDLLELGGYTCDISTKEETISEEDTSRWSYSKQTSDKCSFSPGLLKSTEGKRYKKSDYIDHLLHNPSQTFNKHGSLGVVTPEQAGSHEPNSAVSIMHSHKEGDNTVMAANVTVCSKLDCQTVNESKPSVVTVVKHTPTVHPPPVHETDELDDMLDELLLA